MNKWYRWTVIAAFLIVLGVTVRTCYVSRVSLDQLSDELTDEDQVTGLTLQNVTLEQPGKDGQVLWKVHAQSVTYSPDQQVAQIKAPEGEFYQQGKIIYRVKADMGEIRRNGEDILLRGNITAVAVEPKLTLRGNQLEWQPSQDLLWVRDRIQGEHPQLQATAQEAKFFNRTKRLELKGGAMARTTTAPWLSLKAEALTWHIAEARIETDQPLQAEQYTAAKEGTVTARIVGKAGEVRLDKKTVRLTQAVQFDLPDQPLQATSTLAVWAVAAGTIDIDAPVRVQQPKQQITITAQRAKIDLKQRIVYLIRQVQAIRQKNAAQLTADRLTWHIDSQAVEAEGNITYRQQNPTATLSGKRAAGNLEQQTMVISGGDVVTEITPE